jgi:hypothetical protein
VKAQNKKPEAKTSVTCASFAAGAFTFRIMAIKDKTAGSLFNRLAFVGNIGSAFLPVGYKPEGYKGQALTVSRKETGRWGLGEVQDAFVAGKASGNKGTDCRIWLTGSKTAKGIIAPLSAHLKAGRLLPSVLVCRVDGAERELTVYVTPRQLAKANVETEGKAHAMACEAFRTGCVEFSLISDGRNASYTARFVQLGTRKAAKND